MSTKQVLVKDDSIHYESYYFNVIAKLEIRITIRCNDGHNCAGISDSINDASEEALTQQKQDTQSVIEQILADFKSRVDPEDFVQYLTKLKEEDEVSMLYLANTKFYSLNHVIHTISLKAVYAKSSIARLIFTLTSLCVSYTHCFTRKFILYNT